MPEGIPSPESGTLIFEADMKLQLVANIGRTPFGNRQVAVVQDGVLKGDRLSGAYLSSNPGMKPGGVGLTFYESVR
jgi:hypothetical protein